MRPWLNWIEQQISNLWVAGSSPAGRTSLIHLFSVILAIVPMCVNLFV